MSKKKYTFKKLVNDIHLWLGLGSGIILFLVCLSGTFLTFEEEIKGLFTEKLEVTAASEKISFEDLNQILSKEGTISSITVSEDALEPYEFRVKTSEQDRRGTLFFVDPYTGAYQKTQKSSADGFFMTMFRMHRWLLMDSKIGRPIVGFATIFFLFISITGVIMWFPKKMKWKSFKPGLKIKTSANWKRINHDLHNTLGFYACIFLIIMTLTGLCWSFQWYRDASSAVLGTQVFGGRGGEKFDSKGDFQDSELKSITEIYSISNSELNYGGKTSIGIPSTEKEPFSIRKYNSSNWSPVTADQLVIDRNGAILNKSLFSDKPFNVQVASLIKPIHTGQILGTFSKIIYFLACLIATSLPITGTIIWLNKMKKKNKKKRSKSKTDTVLVN